MNNEYPVAVISDTRLSSDYLLLLKQYPVLTLEQELDYSRQWVEYKKIEAAHTLVFSNLRGVVYVARNYLGYGLSLMDLVQEGTVGLMKAVKNYSLEVGVRLFAYALPWIKSEIQSYIVRNWKMVRGATTDARKKLFFNLRRLKNEALPLEKNITNIASALHVSEEDVRAMDQYLYAPSVDIAELTDIEDVHTPDTLLELKQDEEAADIALHLVTKLPVRERRIIEARFIQEPSITLAELAKELCISIERVRQLEKQAIIRLREMFYKPKLGVSSIL